MHVTYIGHSGFLLEWESCYLLFDYYTGKIPELDPKKKIFVFASHKHRDHFNPGIFDLADQYGDIEYVLSSDIKLKNIRPKAQSNSGNSQITEEHLNREHTNGEHPGRNNPDRVIPDRASSDRASSDGANPDGANPDGINPGRADQGESPYPGLPRKILTVKPEQEYELFDINNEKISLKTLRSTDSGVAFLLQYGEKTVYHAGDLNLWVWKEESLQSNNNMTARFNKIMLHLKDVSIDAAFAPLDPRQEEWYSLGLESLLRTARVKYVFPMHFWNKTSVIRQFKLEKAAEFQDTEIMEINKEGQSWNIL